MKPKLSISLIYLFMHPFTPLLFFLTQSIYAYIRISFASPELDGLTRTSLPHDLNEHAALL